MNSKILVATHKQYVFPPHELYTPIHVGKALTPVDFGYLGDDTQENISNKNRNFCELTALYWAWKNNFFENAYYIGLVHYRRHFHGDLVFNNSKILSDTQIVAYLKDYDVIVPKKRNYYIESIATHYKNAHYEKDLLETESIIKKFFPEYQDAFSTLVSQKKLHLFNMFIMSKENFDNYMTWLFTILFELEKRTDISPYDSYQARLFGFMAERLFNVWLIKNRLKTKELQVVNLEGENLPFKAYNLLKRKFKS